MALNDDYISALVTLAHACDRYRAMTGGEVVLVGGAATVLYTDGEFMSGDFDLVAAADGALEAAMTEAGFKREDQIGYLLRGFYHPAHPGFGFEPVSGRLFDGKADVKRLRKVLMSGDAGIVLPSFEDMIADRLGQHTAASPTDDSRLLQARCLFRLAKT